MIYYYWIIKNGKTNVIKDSKLLYLKIEIDGIIGPNEYEDLLLNDFNKLINEGKCFKENPNGFCAFALRSYISTAVGQFFDNFVFASIVSLHFFGWSIVKCISASFMKMLAELIFEIIFSPIGYCYLKYMEKKDIGKQYLDVYQIELKDLSKEEAKQESDELNTSESVTRE